MEAVMGSITVILGENGKGKTRYLLNYLEENKSDKCIALISNSLINPFPMPRGGSRYHCYRLRARNVMSPHHYSRGINNYFGILLSRYSVKDLFYILRHVGFDDDFIVRRRSLYKIHSYDDDSSNEKKYKLVPSEYSKVLHRGYLNESIELSLGFVEKYSHFFTEVHEFHLTYYSHQLQKQDYLDHLKSEREIRSHIGNSSFNHLFESEFFVRKNNDVFPVSSASSGELYILALGLFIQKFLDDTEKFNLPKVILIDEPENSLHPKWQREYIAFLKGFIGYQDVDVIIATHSPLIAMENDNYNKDISIVSINNGELEPIDYDSYDNNIEQIYYQLFGVLTPKNRYLSEYCNKLLKDFADGKITYDKVRNVIISMSSASFDPKQKDFLDDILSLLNKLRGRVNG
ncbi:TPA: hypothetical protein MHU31_04740 [Klebsiella pneumoniae]|nr:hypothetical protein [Klebsiella pneumoniae]